MESLLNIFEPILESYEVLGIGITLILGFLTQFFPITKEVNTADGDTKRRLTPWGWSVVPLMVVSTLLAVKAHIEGEQKKDQTSSEETERDKTMRLLILNNGIESRKHLEEKLAMTENNIAMLESHTNAVLQRLIGMSEAVSKLANQTNTEKESGENEEALKTLVAQANKNKELLEQLKKANTAPDKYNYVAQYTSFDISKCVNSQTKGIYWDLAINGSQFDVVQPSEAKATLNNNNGAKQFAIKQNAAIEVKDVVSASQQFLFSGYIREYTGRSFFKRNYLYRYPSTFNQIVHFNMPDKPSGEPVEQLVPINLIADDSCQIKLMAKITRTKL